MVFKGINCMKKTDHLAITDSKSFSVPKNSMSPSHSFYNKRLGSTKATSLKSESNYGK